MPDHYTIQGESLTVRQIAERAERPVDLMRSRLQSGVRTWATLQAPKLSRHERTKRSPWRGMQIR